MHSVASAGTTDRIAALTFVRVVCAGSGTRMKYSSTVAIRGESAFLIWGFLISDTGTHYTDTTESMKRAAIGIRAHSGWGALVAISGSPGSLRIIDRRRVIVADDAIAGSKQPYHFSEG